MNRAASNGQSSPRVPAVETRRRILDAAGELFARHGFAGTSVRMIARHLGLTDPAIHYHFRTKQELYEALLVTPAYEGELPPITSVDNAIDQVILRFGWWLSRPAFAQMLLREQLSQDPASIQYMVDARRWWAESITKPLSDVYGDAAIAEDRSLILFDVLCGILWDAVLSYGDGFADFVEQPYFKNRVRELVAITLDDGASVV